MRSIRIFLLLTSLLSPIAATTLYVATTNDAVSTLILSESNGCYSLVNSTSTKDCAPNPSWLTLDSENRILYCLDRASASLNGSVNSFSIGSEGNLTLLHRVVAPTSGVNAHIFGSAETRRGYAMVSYNKSAAAIYTLGEAGLIEGPIEQFFPKLATPGPVPLRQDLSYLHQVIVDPSGKFLVMNDLGADLIRVYSWDAATITPLTEHESTKTPPGAGPRHGVFYTSPNGELYYFHVGEIDQLVYSYSVAYTDTGMSFTLVSSVPALGKEGAKPVQTAPTSGIRLSPDNRFIIVSNRDISFPNSTLYQSGPTDTMSTFSISDSGKLALVQLAPSGGYSPRDFSLNKAGDLIAIGHQGNRTVVIKKRDVDTGFIGDEVAKIVLGGSVMSTIWDE